MKIKKRLLSFILICCVLCGSFVPSFSVSAAPVVSTVAQLASYVLATTGFVNIATNGAVSSASGSVLDALKTKIADTIGSGIYVDSNGNYVFDETTTNEIYDILNSNNSQYDVRVISDFGANFAENALLFRDYPMVSPEMRQNINNYIDNYSDSMNWLIVLQIVPTSSNTYRTFLSFIYMNNVKYLLCNDNNITFRDLNGVSQVRLFDIYYQNYDTNSQSFSGLSHTKSQTADSITVHTDYPTVINFNTFYLYKYAQLIDYSGSASQEFIYNNFPFKYEGKTLIWSNRSLILGKNVEKVNSFLSSGSGNYVSNTYNVIPSISEDTLINNDWGGIYNSYVTNVRNNYNSDMDTTELVNVLKNNTDIINNAISSGVDDIESVIFTTNAWLKKISYLLTSINYKIDNIDSGGGSGVTNDYTQALQRIENYAQGIKGDTARMAQLETYLSQLLSNSDQMVDYLRKIASGNGSPSIPDGWDILPDMPDVDILDTISNMSVLVTALFNVVPFCFITMFGTLISLIAHEPITPVFDIPIEFSNSFINVSETLSIDLSLFDDIRPLVCAFWYILFIVVLLYATFKFFIFLNDFFFG